MKSIISEKNFNDELSAAAKERKLLVIHFFADFVDECALVNDQLDGLGKDNEFQDAIFYKIAAEDVSTVSLKYKIEAVPTIIIFRNGNVVEQVNGINPPEVLSKLRKQLQLLRCDIPPIENLNTAKQQTQSLEERLKGLVNQKPVMLFMKGSPGQPRCGFSRQIVEILRNNGITDFGHFDILTDPEVRQGLKDYSDWPTYPQLYSKGELVGGLDIVRELQSSGELLSSLT